MLALLLGVGPTAGTDAGVCRPATYAEMVQLMQRDGLTDVVVFATWCAPCREHVRRATATTLLVGAFDEPRRLSRAVALLNPRATCVVGEALVQQLGVRGVPMHLSLRDGAFTVQGP